MDNKKRLVVGMTGASCIAIAIDLLTELKEQNEWEIHVVCSNSAAITMKKETDKNIDDIINLSDYYYDNNDISAKIASGTFKTQGMVVVPCSMKTLAGINSGYSDTLLLRVADVTIKERRPLVLVAREMPLSHIHLRNMYELSQMGAIIMPPAMTFYNNPQSIQDMVSHISGKILDVFGIELKRFNRWEG